ncbi:MAG: hypothetical protein FWD59_03545 [Micrococcales bacterium]|nr:hypothetical protein [Micrococcales bacterium]
MTPARFAAAPPTRRAVLASFLALAFLAGCGTGQPGTAFSVGEYRLTNADLVAAIDTFNERVIGEGESFAPGNAVPLMVLGRVAGIAATEADLPGLEDSAMAEMLSREEARLNEMRIQREEEALDPLEAWPEPVLDLTRYFAMNNLFSVDQTAAQAIASRAQALLLDPGFVDVNPRFGVLDPETGFTPTELPWMLDSGEIPDLELPETPGSEQ